MISCVNATRGCLRGDVIKSESLLRMRNGGNEERKRRDRKKEAEETGRKEQAKQGGIRKWTRGIR